VDAPTFKELAKGSPSTKYQQKKMEAFPEIAQFKNRSDTICHNGPNGRTAN
jgi:hypothetical protein